ncbi:MAG: multiheme c-type cytochrome [Mariniblastus sp.]
MNSQLLHPFSAAFGVFTIVLGTLLSTFAIGQDRFSPPRSRKLPLKNRAAIDSAVQAMRSSFTQAPNDVQTSAQTRPLEKQPAWLHKQLNTGLTPEQIQTLSSLPPMCTSELPGLDLSQENRPQAQGSRTKYAANYNGSGWPNSRPQPSSRQPNPNSKFSWPTKLPDVNAEQVQAQAQAQQATQANWQSDNNQFQPNVRTVGYNDLRNHASPDHASRALAPTGQARSGMMQQPAPQNQQGVRTAWAMPNPHKKPANTATTSAKGTEKADGKDPHLDIYSRDAFPSAKECATCHKQIYEEWAASSHAYASVSPMFHKFENKINRLAQGTIGYFCLRCHAPVATTMGLRRDQAIWDGPRVFREGVTCVACHRVKTPYTKADGERRMEPGDIYSPVYGSGNGTGIAIADKYKSFYKVKTNRNNKSPGQALHKRSIQFEELSESTFCMSCHQVAVKPGIKLEVVWDQYRASPACKEGISCQDCHMGKVPGVDAGYSIGPAAVVDGKVVNAERKHSNHMFYGPGYSIAHPGIFPDNLDADRWKFNEWLQFDWRAGWGTDAFEDPIADGKQTWHFPPIWQSADDRYDAREIIDANLKKLEYKRDIRRQLLENGSKLDGPFFEPKPSVGKPLNFRYCLTNLNSGHNMPSGSLGAQPQLWMNVVVINPNGQRIWQSGYLDSNGDLCDNHSLDVLARKIPFDNQLMNLQTKFLTTNVKGTDREMYLPVNFDVDQLPFLRPAPQPVTVINHPVGIRMEGHSIPALGSRNVKYSVPAKLMQQPGTYRISVRMRSRAEPIYFMRFCESTPEMERMMNEWIADFHVYSVPFEVR